MAIALAIAKFKVQSSKFKVAIQISKVFLLLLFILGFWFLIRDINPTEESWVVRSELNAAAIKIWQQFLIFGVGLGNFLTELPKTLPSREIYFLQPVHNIYLLLLAETGIIGLVLFLWLVWIVLRRAISNKQKERGKAALLLAYLLSLIAYLLLGFVDHYPLTLQQGQLLLTLFLGINAYNERHGY